MVWFLIKEYISSVLYKGLMFWSSQKYWFSSSTDFSQEIVPDSIFTPSVLFLVSQLMEQPRTRRAMYPPGSQHHQHHLPHSSAYHLPHITRPYVCPGPQIFLHEGFPIQPSGWLELSHGSQSFPSPWTPSSAPLSRVTPALCLSGWVEACCEMTGTVADPRRTPFTKC